MSIRRVFVFLSVLSSSFFAASIALAEGAAAEGVSAPEAIGLKAIGAGLAIGLAALGGSFGQGLTMSSALSGIARNPNASGKIFAPMILGLALIESLVIYALIIAFMLKP